VLLIVVIGLALYTLTAGNTATSALLPLPQPTPTPTPDDPHTVLYRLYATIDSITDPEEQVLEDCTLYYAVLVCGTVFLDVL
jgi:hypothetical protein